MMVIISMGLSMGPFINDVIIVKKSWKGDIKQINLHIVDSKIWKRIFCAINQSKHFYIFCNFFSELKLICTTYQVVFM